MNYWNKHCVVNLLLLMALASSVHPDPGIHTIPILETTVGLPNLPGSPVIPGHLFVEFVKNIVGKAKDDILSMCTINGFDDPTAMVPHLGEDDYRYTNKSYCLRKCERIYVNKRAPSEERPRFFRPQITKLQEEVYAREKRQRRFEYIGRRTDGSSTVLAGLNPKHLAAACSCARKRPPVICNPLYKYRSIDGTCNNLQFPRRGSVLNCLQRFVPPRYEGVSGFRQSVCGKPLPEPRKISLKMYLDRNRPTKVENHMTLFFGQFVAHDITDVPSTFVSTKPIDCCSNPGGKHQHPQCAPIIISKHDPFYSKFNVTCFNFVRAAPCDNCDIGKRNQMNQVTSFIDLSLVYGLDDEDAKNLRSKDGDGTLKIQGKKGEELLPADPKNPIPGDCGLKQEKCFLAGDRRVNMHTPLMCLHTVFIREHNRIAKELHKFNPSWNDETLYQEARRICIAQFQYIIYNEYLPLLLQPYLLTIYELHTTIPSVYIPLVDATLWAEVNGAAYRLHSALNGIVAEHGSKPDKRLFRNNFNDAEPLYSGNISPLMSGICQTPAQHNDRFVTKEMTQFLYKPLRGSFGFDIASINIQRGRDLGLPTYVEMVKFFTLGSVDIKTFKQLSKYMDKSNIKVLKKIYCNVKDIDLWVGLNNERPDGDTLLGPTAAKMVGFQFFAMKFGDRFFFQHFGNLGLKQLAEIKKASFAGLLCQNTKIKSIQKNAFKAPSVKNPIVDCSAIPKVDLSFWTKA